MKTTKKTTKKKNKPIKETDRLQNPKWELFCHYYAVNTSTFGNATMSYAGAYGFDLENLSHEAVYEEDEDGHRHKVENSPYDVAYETCKTSGTRLLTNVHIDERINKLLYNSMSDELIDTERMYVIKQRENLAAKNSAMRDFDKVKGRIVDKFEINNVPVDPNLVHKGNDVLEKYLNGIAKNTTKE